MSIWPNTKVTNLFKIELPIIQAPMAGGATTPELVAAVSNAGGLGSLSAGYMKPDAIRKAIIEIRQLTNKPFAVNLFMNRAYFQSIKIFFYKPNVMQQSSLKFFLANWLVEFAINLLIVCNHITMKFLTIRSNMH